MGTGWRNITYWMAKIYVDGFAEIEDEQSRNALCDLLQAQGIEYSVESGSDVLYVNIEE